jgi:serine/threonine-protein kinase
MHAPLACGAQLEARVNLNTISKIPPPRSLGRYEVGAKIAGGGMASVYLGRSITDHGQEQLVALKVIKDELAHDEKFIHMFLDEAEILSKLSHRNIIRTLEYGISGEHRFIAMELLLGRSLMDVWDVTFAMREPIALGLSAWIAARVCEGLHYAHELTASDGAPLHVIHRDVNPSNIFLTYDGDVKLIDFGLAKAVGRHSRSADGVVKGKIPYLAPEQVSQQDIDRRADVYALGITLWECIAMKRLFKRENDVATLRAIREAVIPDLRATASCPEEYWNIVSKALAQDPDARYASAAELGAALDRFVRSLASADGPRDRGNELEELLARLFHGERPRQQAWLENVRDRPRPNETMPPPAPVPSVPPEAMDELKQAALDSATLSLTEKAAPSEDTERRPPRRKAPRSREPVRKTPSFLTTFVLVVVAIFLVGAALSMLR